MNISFTFLKYLHSLSINLYIKESNLDDSRSSEMKHLLQNDPQSGKIYLQIIEC